ncbi:glycosyltransferase family 2 protein [bacterium]|jgi:dolichyl-phosphate beta-glucosyltransferase|nr:glycosyltransferase family 2 protein [bacterium]MBT4649481.1 glycosyltransferase family 2 protein [bacterium]
MQLSVVIPVFNEAKLIASTLAKTSNWLEKKFTSFEIIVVDDASTDGTLEIVKKIPDIKVLVNLTNHGKGYTVAKGMRAAQGDLVLFMDADNATTIVELDKLLPYTKKYPIIIASRALAQSKVHQYQHWLKVSLGNLGNTLIRLVLNLSIRDTQCGFKLFNRSAIKVFDKLTINRWGFDFELLFIAKLYNIAVKEVAVDWADSEQVSKVTPASYIKTLLHVFKVRINHLLNKYK